MIHDAKKVAHSSIVGQSIMLLNDKGACIGQLSVINCGNPQEIADEVVAALRAPNRHAYQVGKKVGAAAQKDDGFNLYCPKCGSDEVSHGYSAPPFQGNVQCHADGCEVVAVADTEAKAKALWRSGEWTHELVDRDENGQPTYRPKERD